MSRPKGSLNKPKMFEGGVIPRNSDIEQVILSPGTFEELPKPIHYDLTLSIRAFREGRFKGLWELSKIKSDGNREIVIDATSRQSVINMVNRQIMRMVIPG